MSGEDQHDTPGYYPPGTPQEGGAWPPPSSPPASGAGIGGGGGWPPASGAGAGAWPPASGAGGWQLPASGAGAGAWPPASGGGAGWPQNGGVGGWPPAGGGDWSGWPQPGGYWPPPPPPRRSRFGLVVGLLAMLALLVTAIAVGVGVSIGRTQNQAATSAPAAGSGDQGTGGDQGTQPLPGGVSAAPRLPNAAGIAAKVNQAVVDVNTVMGYQNTQAAGTGVVIGSSGLVLTNNHVVAGSTSITVTKVTDGRQYQASVVGYDRTEDIAVLQMKGASGLATAAIADATKVKVGDAVLAVGNAGGTGGTPSVAEGTVSALNRSITASDQGSGTSEQLTGLIEVAANIQAGDSGGPLVNSAGQVVGINTAASVGFRYQAGSGTGFAIPINQAMSIGRQIIAGRASTKVHIGETAFIGVQIGSGNGAGSYGAPVVGIVSGSPAESAGLAEGDTITSVDGKTVSSPNDLTGLLDSHHPGDRVQVGWVDAQGQRHTATIRPVSGPVG